MTLFSLGIGKRKRQRMRELWLSCLDGGIEWLLKYCQCEENPPQPPPLPAFYWNPSSLIRWKSARCLWSFLGSQWQPLKSHRLHKRWQSGSTCPLKNMPWGYLPWTCRACTDDILISWALWSIFNWASRSLKTTVHQCPHLIGFSLPPAPQWHWNRLLSLL